jgi:hypothetical protein
MALSAAQRRRLPRSAFALRSGPRSRWAYPLPTKGQARAAGISEPARQRMLRAAAAYSHRSTTRGSGPRITAAAKRRASPRGGSRAWGTTATGRRRAPARARRTTATRTAARRR